MARDDFNSLPQHTVSEIKNNGVHGKERKVENLNDEDLWQVCRKCEKIDTLIAGKQINQFTPNEVILRRERNKGVD